MRSMYDQFMDHLVFGCIVSSLHSDTQITPVVDWMPPVESNPHLSMRKPLCPISRNNAYNISMLWKLMQMDWLMWILGLPARLQFLLDVMSWHLLFKVEFGTNLETPTLPSHITYPPGQIQTRPKDHLDLLLGNLTCQWKIPHAK